MKGRTGRLGLAVFAICALLALAAEGVFYSQYAPLAASGKDVVTELAALELLCVVAGGLVRRIALPE